MKKLISIILCLMFALCLLPLQGFAAPITKVELTGIDTPVVGQAPDMKATAGNGYYNLANRIQWKEYNEDKIFQRDLTASDTFRAGHYYAVFVTVFTDSDMPFTSQTTGTIDGKPAQMQGPQDNGCSIVLIYNFSEILKEPVTALDLTIPAPVDGEKPDYTKLDGDGYYSDNGLNGTSTRIYKNGIAWYKSATSAMTPGTGEAFRADADYQLKISLLPKDGYCFHENISVTINGKTATVEFFDDGSINVSVTLTAAGPAHTHTPSAWRTTGAYHYKVCTTCGDFLDQEDHKGGAATCAEKGKCTVCGYEYIDVHENHTPDTSKWVIWGDMYHYHACKLCGAHCNVGDHVAGPAGTPEAAVVCKDCGYIITPAKDHTHNLTKVEKVDATCTEPGNVEYYTCDGCSDFFADSEGKAKLTDTVIAPLGHKVSDDWKHDETNHWRTCTVCNEVLTETQMAHEIESGKCTACGYDVAQSDNTASAPTDASNNTQDATDVTQAGNGDNRQEFPWWGYLVIAVGGIAVGIAFVFVKLKKKD